VPPNQQFPVESYDDFVKQIVPRWTTTDEMTVAAYNAELDRVGAAVIVAHSQAGPFAFAVARLKPDKVKAIVAVEPAAAGDAACAAALKDTPILMLFGDFIAEDARWPKIRQMALEFAAKIKAAGGKVDIVDLPAIGITGNSHLMMMDRNNFEVAQVIERWLASRGLYR
jgi:pimeloyl-ACP methyl ester carboxylesterase